MDEEDGIALALAVVDDVGPPVLDADPSLVLAPVDVEPPAAALRTVT
jgi:hypothetical protein